MTATSLQVPADVDPSTPCICGEPRSRHDAASPHPSESNGCRAFTAAAPLYDEKNPGAAVNGPGRD
jgi:hypothetical protein